MKSLKAILRSEPFLVDALMVVIVCSQGVASFFGWIPNVWAPLIDERNKGTSITIYLAALGPAAIVAGFAAVVIVFGLTANSSRFTRFRAKAGAGLSLNWIHSSLSGFVAVGLSLIATYMAVAGISFGAAFAFELALLILAHGTVRTLWILNELIQITQADDVVDTDAENVYPLNQLPRAPQSRQEGENEGNSKLGGS